MNIGGVKFFFHECCVCVENVCEFVTPTLRIDINFITIVYINRVGLLLARIINSFYMIPKITRVKVSGKIINLLDIV